jgi:hypothetical protein
MPPVLPGARGDVLQGAPAAGEQGESSFFRQRREWGSALRVRVLKPSSLPLGGSLTGI